MNKSVTILISVILGVLLVGGIMYAVKKSESNHEIACTMEAKLCPDGSYVGRTGPNCEFAACPVGQ